MLGHLTYLVLRGNIDALGEVTLGETLYGLDGLVYGSEDYGPHEHADPKGSITAARNTMAETISTILNVFPEESNWSLLNLFSSLRSSSRSLAMPWNTSSAWVINMDAVATSSPTICFNASLYLTS